MLNELTIKLYADGADLPGMLAMAAKPWIAGFTTNPTLMRKAGVRDYPGFAHEVLAAIRALPVSFEVLSDDLGEMESQARTIASWGDNVYVKIPVTNSDGLSTAPLVKRLSHDGIRINVTAVFTEAQVAEIAAALEPLTPAVVSVFAGRIADAGQDPMPILRNAATLLRPLPLAELLWASPREVLNVIQAQESGCHIITATSDILAKLEGLGKDLNQFSLETVRMFARDAAAAGFTVESVKRAGAR